jgi:uncharacterized protein (TIGR00251 family)
MAVDRQGVRLRIAAPPTEGKANRALIKFLSALLGVPPSHITLLRGAAGRHKVVEVVGLSEDEAMCRLRLPHR